MTTALRAAYAVAETRLRLVATLLAAGVPEDCVTYWTQRPLNPRPWDEGGVVLCGVMVCGFLACEVACWRETPEQVIVNASWYGTPARWVPDENVLRLWRAR